MDRLEADVAGVRVAVSASRDWLARNLAARYRRFPPAGSAPAAVAVRVVDHHTGACPADSGEARRAMLAAPFVGGLPDYPLLVEHRGDRLEVTSLHLKGWIDLRAGRGEGLCCTRDAGAAENFLRVAVARLLLPAGGFLLHACAVLTGGGATSGAIVGFGPSGAGKSTLASLAAGRPVLSDDLVVIRRDGAGVLRAIPSLFRDGGAPPRPEGHPVLRLLRLRKGPFGLRPLDRPAAARELLAAMPFVTDDPEAAAIALARADEAAARPGCAELSFPKDPSTWSTLEAAA